MTRNKFNVKVGQVWKDNDVRLVYREFEVVELDEAYYGGGRVKCKLLGEVKKGQRENFYLKLARFNWTKRGYSMVRDEKGNKATQPVEKPPSKAKKKAKKKAAKKKAARKAKKAKKAKRAKRAKKAKKKRKE